MKFFKKPYVFALLFTFVLTAVSLFIILDTFIFAKEYRPETRADIYNSTTSRKSEPVTGPVTGTVTEGAGTPDPEIPAENYYSDGDVTIILTEYREYETSIYVADVRISNIIYLKSAFAKSVYGKNVTETVSEMAENSGAVLAVNGDYYGAQRRGFVIRNGVIYRAAPYSRDREDLVVYSDGSFGIVTEGSTDVSTLIRNGALQVYSFGPALIDSGKIAVDESDEVKHAMESNPRTAIGIIEPLHYVFVVSDGRTEESRGLTLFELANFMEELGAETAYNLDGGGSSAMYFKGRIVNFPTDGTTAGERRVSDIVYIGY